MGSTLILFFHLCPGLPRSLFPVGLHVRILEALLTSILATCPAYLNLVDLITLTILGERYKLLSSSLRSLLHSPFSSLLGPNIRLRKLFSNTHIFVLCILLFKFLRQKSRGQKCLDWIITWISCLRLELINHFTYFSTVFPSNICVFLFCRPFLLIQHFQGVLRVLKLLLSPGLGSGQLEIKSVIIVIVGF